MDIKIRKGNHKNFKLKAQKPFMAELTFSKRAFKIITAAQDLRLIALTQSFNNK